jgi:hypothetical protein
LTLRPQHLPETGKRQYENQNDARAIPARWLDRRSTPEEKIYAIIISVKRNAGRFPMQCNIGNAIQITPAADTHRVSRDGTDCAADPCREDELKIQ